MAISLLHIQAGKNHAQPHIALFKIGNSGHNLFKSGMVTGLIQLGGQICQFLGMGSIVSRHILHQRYQFLHGSMRALRTAAGAVVVTFVGMSMGSSLGMEMIMLMGMGMVMLVGMRMGVGMGNTVVGMLMGMGMLVVVAVAADMIVMLMHSYILLAFFFYYI